MSECVSVSGREGGWGEDRWRGVVCTAMGRKHVFVTVFSPGFCPFPTRPLSSSVQLSCVSHVWRSPIFCTTPNFSQKSYSRLFVYYLFVLRHICMDSLTIIPLSHTHAEVSPRAHQGSQHISPSYSVSSTKQRNELSLLHLIPASQKLWQSYSGKLM